MSKPSKYDETLFSATNDQRQGIQFIESTLFEMADLQDAIMSQQERLLRATGDLAIRVQILEQREEQRRKLRVIK